VSTSSQISTLPKASPGQLTPGARIVLRVFFAVLLTVTGVAKLVDMTGFYEIVRSYQSLPDMVIAPAAWILAAGEVVMAVWLFARYRPRLAAITIVLLHMMYLIWLLAALLRGLPITNCGCFGVFWARPLTWYSPLEDLVLVGLALLYWRLLPRHEVAK
jgi:uncharacterized membrane protein YphA (DoxX/SURF4 family)